VPLRPETPPAVDRPENSQARAPRRLAFLGDFRLDPRLRWILVLYLIVIAGIVGYNAKAISKEQGAALIVNVAARQRALAERYQKDVVLRTQDIQADPEDDAAQLLGNAEALLHGGDVVAVQGADEEVRIPPASDDPRVIVKLEEERRLIRQLVAAGDDLMSIPTSDPQFPDQLEGVRIIGAQVTSVSNDAVGQMTRDTEAAFGRLVAIGIGLGILGAIAAVAMALLLRRASARRSAQFRSLVHNSSDLITVIDADGKIRYQTPSAERIVGVSGDDLIGSDYLELVEGSDEPHVRTLLADLAVSPGATATSEYRLCHKDGSSRFVESIVTSLVQDPTVRGLVLNTRDVTDRKVLEEELAHQAFHDSLTGLSNRAVFRDRVDHALARSARHDSSLTVLLLDLDGFKMVNDSLGHDAGDDLLVAVGARIEAGARASDTVARLGGDEFAILLEEEGDEAQATAAADRVLRELAAPFEVRGREVFMRASIGIAISGGADANLDDLIRNADTAMYAAKAAGKGRYEIFRPIMHTRALLQFEVQADLQRALDRGEFAVHYQPIVDIATGAATGMEALVRWQHPTRGLLPPIEFIGVAEESGLIVPLGRWVLTEACRQTASWQAEYPEASGLKVSVNLSTRQLLESNLVRQVCEVLEETGLDPSSLVLEITEGSLMQDVGATAVKLRDLKDLGVRLAIDDFGTGSSSLAYLQQFPIDLLKIDKSFVDRVTAVESEGPALVRAIIELAQTFHLQTVAEGIEESEQLDELRGAGCLSGQGYLFARPLPSGEMEAYFRRDAQIRATTTPEDAAAPR
jgi:diguanylate cyclase (GGDEF)-like protein/PAS domain S-box-containing protein